MRCSDGNFYVVKFRNNPQHARVLINEMLATRLAEKVGLPVPPPMIVEVDQWLIDHTPELYIQLAHSSVRCEAGFQFGSQYVVDPLKGQVLDYLPSEMFSIVQNLETFAGILVLDKWVGNTDGRQAAFWKLSRERKYHACFIDQGYSFNAGDWSFPDYPLRGIFGRNEVYEFIRDWSSFEPWLSRVENIEEAVIWDIAASIPPQWYANTPTDFTRLVYKLIERRRMVRGLIENFRVSERRPFPNWHQSTFRRNSTISTCQGAASI